MGNFDRRAFLKFLGLGSAATVLSSCSFLSKDTFSEITELSKTNLGLDFKSSIGEFSGIAASIEDELILPEGFKYNIIRSFGDEVFESSDEQLNNAYGANNDYIGFIKYKDSDQEALLFVNHEFVNPLETPFEAKQRKVLGVSIFQIRKDTNGDWVYETDTIKQAKYNRRIDANTMTKVTGPVASVLPEMRGTLANCSGTLTPWGTVLTCEENYEVYGDTYRWKNYDKRHYGWIVEVDPLDKESVPMKHSALGKMAHENAALASSDEEKLVVYMGDDAMNEHIYKFVSSKAINETDKDFLEHGSLYVAVMDKSELDFQDQITGKGSWELMSIRNPKLEPHFSSDAELLLNTRKAAKLLNATATDRPEAIAISPVSKEIFIPLTNNSSKANKYGSIFKIREDSSDHGAMSFTYENYAIGGMEAGFACPDNLAFDSENTLWLATDISGSKLSSSDYEFHGNNALFAIPLSGEHAGKALRFASAPRGAEFCGICFDKESKTLFLSVLHPGEKNTKSIWPNLNNDKKARSSLVAIKQV